MTTPHPCRCRICIAKSLVRALRHIDRGRPLLAADIIICTVFDLTDDAVFVPTRAGKAEPLCERRS